jgi:hypothetical protein
VVKLWISDKLGERFDNTLAVTHVQGGLLAEVVVLDEAGHLQRVGADDVLLVESYLVACEDPPAGAWDRCMATPMLHERKGRS